MGTYVQYGCGWSAPDGWLNFDASPTLKFERIPLIGSLYTKNDNRFPRNVRFGDIVQGLPIENGSAEGVYASHVLEHLSRNDCMVALKNTFELFKSGGVFRLVVPDLESRARAYLQALEKTPDSEANDAFMRGAHLGREVRAKGLFQRLRESLGHSSHLWVWDEASMTRVLRVRFKSPVVKTTACKPCQNGYFLESYA